MQQRFYYPGTGFLGVLFTGLCMAVSSVAAEQSQLDNEIAKALQDRLGFKVNKRSVVQSVTSKKEIKKNTKTTSDYIKAAEQRQKEIQETAEKNSQENFDEQPPKQKKTNSKKSSYLETRKCHGSVIGEVPEEAGQREKTKKVTNQVYQWTDSSGVVHFSAKQPEKAEEFSKKTFENIYTSNVYEDYFKLSINLDLHSGKHRSYYNKHLYQQMKNMYEIYMTILPDDALLQVDVKLWVFNSLKPYGNFFRKYNPWAKPSKTLGFYSGRHYIAAARNRYGKEQVVSTSVHEAAHVFNHANFGRMPRWLNEGLGEYIEKMSFSYPSFTVKPDNEWFARMEKSEISLTQLMSSNNRDWSGSQTTEYYANAWSLVYFLMSSQKGKEALSETLQEHMRSSCNGKKLNTQEILLHHYKGGIKAMEKDFDSWQYAYKAPHVYEPRAKN